MTNSNPEQPSTATGNEDQTTADTAKFVSNKGTEFEVVQIPSGLFRIVMKRGGKAPPICEELFTREALAEWELEKYILKGDRGGYAVTPSKAKKSAKSEG